MNDTTTITVGQTWRNRPTRHQAQVLKVTGDTVTYTGPHFGLRETTREIFLGAWEPVTYPHRTSYGELVFPTIPE